MKGLAVAGSIVLLMYAVILAAAAVSGGQPSPVPPHASQIACPQVQNPLCMNGTDCC